MITTQRRKRHWLTILLTVLALLMLISTATLLLVERFLPQQEFFPPELVAAPRQAIMRIISPFQRAATWVGERVSKAARNWSYRRTLETYYSRLLAENEQLVYKSLLYEEMERENIRLQGLLGEYNAKREWDPLMASVTAKESGNRFSVFTIDKGSEDGVQPGMAVANQYGLIGVVYEVTATTANVVSIIDSRSSIGGILENSRDQGIIKGTLGVEEAATCRMYYLPADSVPRPNDIVITSGVMTTGVEQGSVAEHMPKGLKIGTVRESARHADANKNYIIVQPFVDFMHIELVLVYRYVADPEHMQFADDGQVSYTPVQLDTPRPMPTIGMGDTQMFGATPTPIPRPGRVPDSGNTNANVSDNADASYDPDDLNYLDPDEVGPED